MNYLLAFRSLDIDDDDDDDVPNVLNRSDDDGAQTNGVIWVSVVFSLAHSLLAVITIITYIHQV